MLKSSENAKLKDWKGFVTHSISCHSLPCSMATEINQVKVPCQHLTLHSSSHGPDLSLFRELLISHKRNDETKTDPLKVVQCILHSNMVIGK